MAVSMTPRSAKNRELRAQAARGRAIWYRDRRSTSPCCRRDGQQHSHWGERSSHTRPARSSAAARRDQRRTCRNQQNGQSARRYGSPQAVFSLLRF